MNDEKNQNVSDDSAENESKVSQEPSAKSNSDDLVDPPFGASVEPESGKRPITPVSPVSPMPPTSAPGVGEYYSNQNVTYNAPPNEGLAVPALIAGIIGLTLCSLLSPLGWILGAKSRKRIKESNGQLGGDGLALGGMVCGIVGTVILALVLAYFFFFFLFISGSIFFSL